MFAFYHPILLGGVNARSLVNDPMICEKIAKGIKFSPFVHTYLFDFGVEMCLGIGKKGSKVFLCFTFMVHEKNPCKPCKIIHHSQKIVCPG